MIRYQCMDSIDELGEKAFSTECMHIFCKVRYAQDASTSLTPNSPAFFKHGESRQLPNPNVLLCSFFFFPQRALTITSTGYLCKKVLTHCPFPAHALLDPCRVHRLKLAPPASSPTAEPQQPPALSTANVGLGFSNDSEDGDPPSSAGRKKKNRRGGKLRKKELARKKKAEGRVKDGARGGA